MVNEGDSRGFDLINHAIRIGDSGDVLECEKSDVRKRQDDSNTAKVVIPTEAPKTVPLTRTGQNQVKQQAERLNPNAFQFPWKLHDMLDNSASEGLEHIVSWEEGGMSFRVHKPQPFVENVMQAYFKQTKYKSFQRQLNLYGFTRINEGPAKGGYRHRFFVRGQRSLCQFISRTSSTDPPATDSPSTKSTQGEGSSHGQRTSSKDGDVRRTMTASYGKESLEVAFRTDSRHQTAVVTSSSSYSSNESAPSDSCDTETKSSDDLCKGVHHKEFQFPWKLLEMLDRSSLDSFEHIVSWQPQGLCFKVHDPTTFVSTIMPRFFKQTKYKSFQRQLNLYGFLRIDEGPNKGGYRHPSFVKGRPELLHSMTRQKIRNASSSSNTKDVRPNDKLPPPRITKHDESGSVHSNSGIPAILAAIESTEGVFDTINKDHTNTSCKAVSWRRVESKECSDFVIEVVDRKTKSTDLYHVHRSILAAGSRHSEYFASVFRDSNPPPKCVLELGKVEAEVFPLVLDYLYTDSGLCLDASKAYPLYSLADHLEISGILQAVTEFYCQTMTTQNVSDILVLGNSFHDKTLLRATVTKLAEETKFWDYDTACGIDPEILLDILQNCKTLPQNLRCGTSRLSQLVAACTENHCSSITPSTFYRLTEETLLPCVESRAAIVLLSTENKLLRTNPAAGVLGAPSLRRRCISSISKNWEEIREELEKDVTLSRCMKDLPSPLLYDILMNSTAKN